MWLDISNDYESGDQYVHKLEPFWLFMTILHYCHHYLCHKSSYLMRINYILDGSTWHKNELRHDINPDRSQTYHNTNVWASILTNYDK